MRTIAVTEKTLVGHLFGMPVVVDPSMPKDRIEIRDPNNGKLLGVILHVSDKGRDGG